MVVARASRPPQANCGPEARATQGRGVGAHLCVRPGADTQVRPYKFYRFRMAANSRKNRIRPVASNTRQLTRRPVLAWDSFLRARAGFHLATPAIIGVTQAPAAGRSRPPCKGSLQTDGRHQNFSLDNAPRFLYTCTSISICTNSKTRCDCWQRMCGAGDKYPVWNQGIAGVVGRPSGEKWHHRKVQVASLQQDRGNRHIYWTPCILRNEPNRNLALTSSSKSG